MNDPRHDPQTGYSYTIESGAVGERRGPDDPRQRTMYRFRMLRDGREVMVSRWRYGRLRTEQQAEQALAVFVGALLSTKPENSGHYAP